MAAAAKKIAQLEGQLESIRMSLNPSELDSFFSKWRSLHQGDTRLELIARAEYQFHLDLWGRAMVSNDIEAARLLELVESRQNTEGAPAESDGLDMEAILLRATLRAKCGDLIGMGDADSSESTLEAAEAAASAPGAKGTMVRALLELHAWRAVRLARSEADANAARKIVEAELEKALQNLQNSPKDAVYQAACETLLSEQLAILLKLQAGTEVLKITKQLLVEAKPFSPSVHARRHFLFVHGTTLAAHGSIVAGKAKYSTLEEAMNALLAMEHVSVALDGEEERFRCNLLALGLLRTSHLTALVRTLQNSVVYRFGDHQLWFQLAMALHLSEEYDRAFMVLQECMALAPNDPVPAAFAARLCVNELDDPERAIQYAQRAVDLGGGAEANLVHGVSLSLLALRKVQPSPQSRTDLLSKAAASLEQAVSLNPRSGVAVRHLALVYAELRDVTRALTMVGKAIELRPTCTASWLLLIVLLTAKRQYMDALKACEHAAATIPEESSRFAVLRGKILFELGRVEEALGVYLEVFKLRARHASTQDAHVEAETPGIEIRGERSRSLVSSVSMDFADVAGNRDEVLRQDSGMGTIGRASSRISYDGAVSSTTAAVKMVDFGTLELWLLCAEAYSELGNMEQAQKALAQAKSISPNAPVVQVVEGILQEAAGHTTDALNIYERVLSINPNYVPCLLRSARIHLSAADAHAAEALGLAVVRLDPLNDEAWLILGSANQLLSDVPNAASCFKKSIDYNSTSGIIPYAMVPRLI